MLSDNPLITVIIPVYNVEDYILKCLNSVADQSYRNLELIIIDDGSTDASGKICDNFAKKEPRATVFRRKNGGLSSARNFGIKKAKGDIIAFIDSDDWVLKNYITKLYRSMQQNNSDISVCGYDDVVPRHEVLTGKKATIRLLTEQKTLDLVTWNKLYKKALFTENKIYFPEGDTHEDILTTYKLLSKSSTVSYISDSLYRYVNRKNSITNSEGNIKKLAMRERAAREAMSYFKDNEDLRAAASISLLWAKYAYLDFAIFGKINHKYEQLTLDWLSKNAKDFRHNKFLSRKLKIYNLLSTRCNGRLYKLFRIITKS